MAASAPALAVARTPLQQLGDRLLEAAPGLITWVLLLSPAWIPIAFGSDGAIFVAVAVLIFDLYWFLRSAIVITGIWRVYFRMRRAMRTDWLSLCQAEPRVEGRPHPLDYYHLCVIPTYTEPYHVLEATVQAIVDARYPKEWKRVAIITRWTDTTGWWTVVRQREQPGAQSS